MKRWAWKISCALSLLLFVASLVFWARSYFVAEGFRQYARYSQNGPGKIIGQLRWFEIRAESGRLEISWITVWQDSEASRMVQWFHDTGGHRSHRAFPKSRSDRINVDIGDFSLVDAPSPNIIGMVSAKIVAVPLWIFLIPAGVISVVWWWRRQRTRRRGFPIGTETGSANAGDARGTGAI